LKKFSLSTFITRGLLAGLLLAFFAGSAFSAITLSTEPVKVQLYGFVKLDAFYDNTEVYQGDWMLFVRPEGSTQSETNVFSMNARASRMGLKMSGPALTPKIGLNALLEMDFSGGFPNSSSAARQPLLRLRQAWVELNNAAWELRLGQDWGLISGPFPNTTDAVVGAAKGNLWMGFSQIKLTLKHDPIKVAVSVNRPMSGNLKYDSYTGGDLDIVDDGERSGRPWLMGRVWYSTKMLTASISGHYGKESIADLAATKHDMTTYSANADVVLNLGKLSLTGRVFSGENLNTFFGGVVQGYVTGSTTVTNIAAQGGWAQAVYQVSPKWALTAGAGLDDPDDTHLVTGARSRNFWKYGNLTWKPVGELAFMFEVNHLTTDYIAQDSGTNLRLQFTTTYTL